MSRLVAIAVVVLSLVAGERSARAACTYFCTATQVDASCAPVAREIEPGQAADLVARCQATCTDAGVTATGNVDPTSVPVLGPAGYPAGYPSPTGRTCGDEPVVRWLAPLQGGRYQLGTMLPNAGLTVRVDAARELALAHGPAEELPPPPRDWDDRRGFAFELGAGPVAALLGRGDFAFGGLVSVGLHDVREELQEEHGEKFSWPVARGLRWCAPLACGMPLLLLFAPPDSLLGNERGVDLVAEVTSTPDGAIAARFGVQPILRYARGIARTGTMVGGLLPELAFATGGGRSAALAFAWTLMPMEFLVDRRHFAVGFEPLRAGFRIPLDGTPVAGEMRTAISFRWVR